MWARALGAVSLVPGWGHCRGGQSWPASNTRLCRVNRKQYLALGWDPWEGVSTGQKLHFVDSNFKRRLLSVWETPPALVKTLVWLFCLVCKQLGGGFKGSTILMRQNRGGGGLKLPYQSRPKAPAPRFKRGRLCRITFFTRITERMQILPTPAWLMLLCLMPRTTVCSDLSFCA